MSRVLIVGKIHPKGLAILEAEDGLEIEMITDPDAELSKEKLATTDALLIRYGKISEADAEQMPNLRIVSRHGVGCDNLPVAALGARGVPVTIVGPVTAGSVAEQVMAMLMALIKKIALYDAAVRKGDWGIRDSLQVGELAGRTLMILGFGRIGREVARRALAFDMKVAIHDPFVSADEIQAAGYQAVEDWRATLPEMDVISLHLPMTAETRGLIGAGEIAAMKSTAILINAARGGLVDEEALYTALTGPMSRGGAGMDCFDSEPPTPDQPLLSLPNVVLSPHSASLSEEAAQCMGIVAAQNILDGLHGKLKAELVFNLKALQEAGHEL
jgi:D-3-phosphoglycerate dehydrogenase